MLVHRPRHRLSIEPALSVDMATGFDAGPSLCQQSMSSGSSVAQTELETEGFSHIFRPLQDVGLSFGWSYQD